MKKQLLISILTIGLLGNYAQAVDTKDLIQAINDHDGDVFVDLLEALEYTQNFLKKTQELLDSGINLNTYLSLSTQLTNLEQLSGSDELTIVETGKKVLNSMRAIDILFIHAVGCYAYDIVLYARDSEVIIKMITVLLERGANVNLKLYADDTTVLIQAVKYGDVTTTQLLLSYGADVNLKDFDGCTALIYAIRDHDAAMVFLLLAHGADVMIGKYDGKTALDCAMWAGPSIILAIQTAFERKIMKMLDNSPQY